MSIGERIKELRLKNGYSQVTFADKIGVSKQTLYKYENNIITNIPSDKISLAAKFLNVSPGYLMGWDNKSDPGVAFNYTEDTQKRIFSENLKRYINKSGKTQKEIAKDIGTSPQNLNNWVKGISYPRISTIHTLADYFKIETTDLINSPAYETSSSEETQKLISIIKELSDEELMKLRLYIDFMKQAEEIDKKSNND